MSSPVPPAVQPERSASGPGAYAAVLAAVFLAGLIRGLLNPWLGDNVPFVTFYPAIAYAAWQGGWRLTAVAMLLSFAAALYLFVPPQWSITGFTAPQILGAALFLASSGLIAGFVQALRQAQAHSQAAEASAQQQHELLRVTLASIGDAVITTDARGRVTFLNAVAEELTGWSAATAAGQPLETIFRIVNEETRQPVENPVEKVLRDGRIVGLANHTVLISRNGQERPIDDSAAPIRNRGGEIVGVVLVFRDIGEKRDADLQLRASTERFRLAADAVNGIIYECDLQTGAVDRIRGLPEVLGYRPEEVPPTIAWWSDQVHPDDRPRNHRSYADAAAGSASFVNEYRVRHRDGHWVHIEDRALLLRDADGQPHRMIGCSVDVSERKRAEVELRRRTDRLRLLWEAAEVLLSTNEPDEMLRTLFAHLAPHLRLDGYFNFLVTEDGQRLELASCHGVSPAEAAQMTRLEFDQAVCGAVAASAKPIIATHIQSSEDPRVQLVKGLGMRAYACNPLIAGGRVIGTLSFASRARDEFTPDELEFLETICHYVTAAHERLRLIDQLRTSDRRKDEFLATLAHELRNPLAPVRNAVQILKAKGPPDPELAWGREVIDRQVQIMARLLDELLDISRISRNRLELRKERVTMAEVVESAVETSRPLIDQAGHQLTVDLPAEPLVLDADPIRLAQVIANLLNNAAKYTDAGGHIRLRAERRRSEVLICVEDDGIGIAPEMLPRVFEIFSQAKPALERSQGGLGIGLSLVRGLVELHGGRVTAQSDGIGCGSEFVVRLPLAVAAPPPAAPVAAAAAPAQPAAAPPPVKPRVLVADDNEDSANSLAMLLRISGFDVKTAYDGAQAVETAATLQPDIVLLDIGMPKQNGYEACRAIRQQPGGAERLMIALTGWGQEDDRRRTEEAGFDHHLVKPVDVAQLLALLRQSNGQTAKQGARTSAAT